MINSLGINKSPNQTRVVVAMSGGVDSSVVAATLKRDGYEVIGITMQLYASSSNTLNSGKCCGGIDIKDAAKISRDLNFPQILNLGFGIISSWPLFIGIVSGVSSIFGF